MLYLGGVLNISCIGNVLETPKLSNIFSSLVDLGQHLLWPLILAMCCFNQFILPLRSIGSFGLNVIVIIQRHKLVKLPRWINKIWSLLVDKYR